MTDTAANGAPAPNPNPSPELQTIASDLRGFVATGKMTQAQADAALKEAGGIPGNPSPPAATADVSPAGARVPAASGGDAATAKAEIDRLTSGADAAWLKAYLNASDPDHQAAVDKMTKLHEAAYPEAAPAEAAPDMGSQSNMPFEFEAHEAPARMQEVQTAAREVVSALGIDESLARGAVQTLDRAVNQRRVAGSDGRLGAPVAMTPIELAKMESMLQQRWGTAYDSKMDAVERAVAQAGKNGPWLKRTILHAGPIAAVWACETLATQGARLAPACTG